jgi:hypothetical protein
MLEEARVKELMEKMKPELFPVSIHKAELLVCIRFTLNIGGPMRLAHSQYYATNMSAVPQIGDIFEGKVFVLLCAISRPFCWIESDQRMSFMIDAANVQNPMTKPALA